MHEDIERVLFSERAIWTGIDRVAHEVCETLGDGELTVVSVLKGSFVFAADLVRRLPIPLELAFVWASSYGSGTEPSMIDLHFMPEGPEVEGRRLLLVDDILDTGRTLARVHGELMDRNAREVRTCVFLDKPTRRQIPFEADFRVFEVEDLFVVGYGLDFDGRYRNLPYVGTLRRFGGGSGASEAGARAGRP